MSEDGGVNRPDILSMIDQAVQDWETGPDAMRWSPDPPGASAYVAGEWLRANGYVLDGWQSAVLGGVFSYDHGDGYTIIDEAPPWIDEATWQRAVVTTNEPCPVCGLDDGCHNLALHLGA